MVVHSDTSHLLKLGNEPHGVMAIAYKERDAGTPPNMSLPLTMSDVVEIGGAPIWYKSWANVGAHSFLGYHQHVAPMLISTKRVSSELADMLSDPVTTLIAPQSYIQGIKVL